MPHAAKFPASFESRKSPVCIRRAALVTHAIIITREFATSMVSVKGSPSDATDVSLPAKKRPQLILSLKKHGTVKHVRSPIKKEMFNAAAQGFMTQEV